MLLIFGLCAIPVPAQQKAGLQEKLKRIEQMIQQEMQKSEAPGLAVAIQQDGKVVYSKGFGYADVENKVPFTPQTVSRIGSISTARNQSVRMSSDASSGVDALDPAAPVRVRCG